MGKFDQRRLDKPGRVPSPKPGASGFGWAKGQSMAEFAMVAIPFILLLFAVMEYAWLMFAQMNIQQAVDDGGRYASTGQEGSAGTRITSIINTIQNEISVPGVNVAQNISICSVPPGTTPAGTCSCTSGGSTLCYNSGADSGNTGAAGGPGYIVTLTLTTPLPLIPLIGQFFSTGGYTFTSSATFLNEPFNPSTTD